MADDDSIEPKTSNEENTSNSTTMDNKKIAITVKTPKEKQTFNVDNDLIVKSVNIVTPIIYQIFYNLIFVIYLYLFFYQFKEIVAPKFNADVNQLCLIFAGKVMKDNDTLTQHNIKDGLTIHLVIRSAPRTPDNTTGSSRQPGKFNHNKIKHDHLILLIFFKQS